MLLDMLFASRYSNFTCLDSSCLQASITVMTCLVWTGGGALQYCYKLIIAISAISPSSTYPLIPQHLLPPSPPQYIGSCKLSANIAQCLSTLYLQYWSKFEGRQLTIRGECWNILHSGDAIPSLVASSQQLNRFLIS